MSFIGQDGDGEAMWLRVVGVVESLVQACRHDPTAAFLYLPVEQSPRQGMALVARPRGEALAATASIRREI